MVISGMPAATALSMLSFNRRCDPRRADQNPGRLLLHGLIQRVALALGVVILRPGEARIAL